MSASTTAKASPGVWVNESGTESTAGDVPPTKSPQSVPEAFWMTNPRTALVMGEVALIPLTKGEVARISVVDLYEVGRYNWHLREAGGRRYAARSTQSGGVRGVVYMHHVVAGRTPGLDVDHKDGDGLNNVRSNLRTCTRKQNLANKAVARTNRLGLKGVWERNGTFRATISIGGRSVHLGPFATAEEAAAAYTNAAREAHGEFARGSAESETP